MYAVALGSPCVLVQINSPSLLISSSHALITKLSHLIYFLKIKDFKMDSFSLSINSVIDIYLFSTRMNWFCPATLVLRVSCSHSAGPILTGSYES